MVTLTTSRLLPRMGVSLSDTLLFLRLEALTHLLSAGQKKKGLFGRKNKAQI